MELDKGGQYAEVSMHFGLCLDFDVGELVWQGVCKVFAGLFGAGGVGKGIMPRLGVFALNLILESSCSS